jgi:mannan endo-1,4-beta-mannosidase
MTSCGRSTAQPWDTNDLHAFLLFGGQSQKMYKNNAEVIINRRNTFTGVMYKDDPTIIGWELANEPKVPGDATGDILQVRAMPRSCAQ